MEPNRQASEVCGEVDWGLQFDEAEVVEQSVGVGLVLELIRNMELLDLEGVGSAALEGRREGDVEILLFPLCRVAVVCGGEDD